MPRQCLTAFGTGMFSASLDSGMAIVILAVFGTLLIALLAGFLLVREIRTHHKKKNTNSQPGPEKMKLDAIYDIVFTRIQQVNGQGGSILFAASGTDSLPITIPVNTAMKLAANHKRCLLIDMDHKRDAIAQAFDLKKIPDITNPKPRKTVIDNLLIWPAHNFSRLQQENINFLIEAAGNNFDYVLISAPCLEQDPFRRKIASSSKCSFIFTKNVRQAKKLASLIKASNSKLIGNIQYSGKE